MAACRITFLPLAIVRRWGSKFRLFSMAFKARRLMSSHDNGLQNAEHLARAQINIGSQKIQWFSSQLAGKFREARSEKKR